MQAELRPQGAHIYIPPNVITVRGDTKKLAKLNALGTTKFQAPGKLQSI